MHKQFPKGRRDHYLPQGYLKEFIDPARIDRDRPLWCYRVLIKKWEQKAPVQIGYERGFYDFEGESIDAEHLEVSFKEMEDKFPSLRDHLVETQFLKWKEHLPFLCKYMQMIRARSPLFFRENRTQLAKERVWTVAVVDRENNRVTLDDMNGRPMRPYEIKNFTLSRMRSEIKAGVGWMEELHWTMRITNDVADPVICGEQPLIMRDESPFGTPGDYRSYGAHFFFPICWKACLVGNRLPFRTDIQPFAKDKLRAYRSMVFQMATDFVISPQQVFVG